MKLTPAKVIAGVAVLVLIVLAFALWANVSREHDVRDFHRTQWEICQHEGYDSPLCPKDRP